MAKKQKQDDDDSDFLKIDENALDKEWMLQADLRFEWGVKLADAKKELDDAEAFFALTKAELDGNIREDPAAYGVKCSDRTGAPTEPTVAAAILMQKDYKSAQSDVHDARHKVNHTQAAVIAIDHRKAALENLVELFGLQYFAAPRAKGEGAKEFSRDAERRAAYHGRRSRDEEDDE